MDGFNPADFPVLGKGVWSRVHDLSDRTVIKLVKEAAAGMNTGRSKFNREIEVLGRLQHHEDLKGLVPEILAHGVISAESLLAVEGYALWVRMTKMPGDKLDIEQINHLPPYLRQKIGKNLGQFIGRLHKALANADIPPLITEGAPFDELRSAFAQNDFYLKCVDIIEAEYNDILSSMNAMPCHNDCNPSNLLLDGMNISAVLDFAECNHNFFEKDLSDILKKCPSLQDPLIAAYEEETGRKVSGRLITFGLAEVTLYDIALISDERENRIYQEKFFTLMERLGYSLSRDMGRKYSP